MDQLTASLPRHYGKWWVYLVILLTPGSFLVVSAVALYRLIVTSAAFKSENQ